MLIEYEIDCWKCNDMHRGTANTKKEFLAIINGGGDWQHTVKILDTEPRRLRVAKRGKLWLIPWTRGRGILLNFLDDFSLGGQVQVMKWMTARWEFADYGGGTPEWNDNVLGGPRV